MNKIINILKEKKSIPLDQFINISLYNKKFGYYMTKNPLGKDGDFITAPLISNLFGEMLAIWCVAFWEHMGKPRKILLVELGPGDGTLCKDLIKTLKELLENIGTGNKSNERTIVVSRRHENSRPRSYYQKLP